MMLRKIICSPLPIARCLLEPKYEREYSSVNIFKNGRPVLVASPRDPGPTKRFLGGDCPNIVVKRVFPVYDQETGPHIRIRFKGRFLRLCGTGHQDVIYGALYEEGGAKYFLGWIDQREWGEISKINLAFRLAQKNHSGWILEFPPQPVVGLASALQETHVRNRSFRRALPVPLHKDQICAYDFRVTDNGRGVGEVQIQITPKVKWKFAGFQNFARVQARISVQEVPRGNRVKVLDFFPFDPQTLDRRETPVSRWVVATLTKKRWLLLERPILFASSSPRYGARLAASPIGKG